MKKLLFIPISLISFSCFSLLEKSLDRMENKMDETVDNCKPSCTDYKVSEEEWCDCMYTCLNNGKLKWELIECKADSTNNQ
tara:strand:- start:1137 stop:1379 length:243 start_codon:yes stop_codon:yes gene_type:complete